MKHLPLRLNDVTEEESLQIIESTRVFVEIILESGLLENQLQIIEKKGSEVLSLQLKNMELDEKDATLLCKVISEFPKLQKIFFESITFDGEVQSWINNFKRPVELKKLTELVATNCDSRVKIFN